MRITATAFGPAAEEVVFAQLAFEELGGSGRFAVASFSGSRAVGLGHANSDVDLHVLVRPGIDLDRTSFAINDRRVQLVLLSDELLVQFAELTEAYVATRRDRTQSHLDERTLWHVIRLACGHVLHADEEYEAMLSRANPDVVRQVVAANFAHNAARDAGDADGMLERDDGHGACYLAARALAAACQVALAASGDVYALERYLIARLRRSPVLAPKAPELWRLLNQLPGYDADVLELRAATVERLFAANGLVAESLIRGWDEPLAVTPRIETAGGDGALRAPGWGLMRFSDAFALAGPQQSIAVGEAVASVWAACDGGAISAIVPRVAHRKPSATSTEAVERAIAQLADMGAVCPPSGRSA